MNEEVDQIAGSMLAKYSGAGAVLTAYFLSPNADSPERGRLLKEVGDKIEVAWNRVRGNRDENSPMTVSDARACFVADMKTLLEILGE